MDNFEWAEGFEPRFGLYEIDYATQKRKLRHSGEIYHELIKNINVVEQV
jgi:beta-glucosidase